LNFNSARSKEPFRGSLRVNFCRRAAGTPIR
jgi:hypothetical protein